MNNKLYFDYDGRRSGTDRRRFSYSVHIPERRTRIDRRKNSERRSDQRKYAEYIITREEDQEQAI